MRVKPLPAPSGMGGFVEGLRARAADAAPPIAIAALALLALALTSGASWWRPHAARGPGGRSGATSRSARPAPAGRSRGSSPPPSPRCRGESPRQPAWDGLRANLIRMPSHRRRRRVGDVPVEADSSCSAARASSACSDWRMRSIKRPLWPRAPRRGIPRTGRRARVWTRLAAPLLCGSVHAGGGARRAATSVTPNRRFARSRRQRTGRAAPSAAVRRTPRERAELTQIDEIHAEVGRGLAYRVRLSPAPAVIEGKRFHPIALRPHPVRADLDACPTRSRSRRRPGNRPSGSHRAARGARIPQPQPGSGAVCAGSSISSAVRQRRHSARTTRSRQGTGKYGDRGRCSPGRCGRSSEFRKPTIGSIRSASRSVLRREREQLDGGRVATNRGSAGLAAGGATGPTVIFMEGIIGVGWFRTGMLE